jgi:NTE family protein
MLDFSKPKVPHDNCCLVLGGGGARAPYEIGVWKALREMGLKFEAVAGTSAGALNAAFVALGDYAAAEDLYLNITIDQVINIPDEFLTDGKISRDLKNLRRLSRFLLARRGLDTEPLRGLIHRYMDENRIRASGLDFGLVVYDLSSMKPRHLFLEDIPRGKLPDYLLASASHPLFRVTHIDEARLTDGGVSDNIPFNMMKERGYRDIIAVDLSGMGRTRKPQIENTRTTYIKNSQRLTGIMDFCPGYSRRSLDLGYLDTLRTYDRLEGIRYFLARDPEGFHTMENALAAPELRPVIREACEGLGPGSDSDSAGPELIRQILPREYAAYRNLAVPLLECAAGCLALPRDRLYSRDQLLADIREGFRTIESVEPLSRGGNLRGPVRRLGQELEQIRQEGFIKLSPARYVSALRTVLGRDDRNLSVRMLQPLFPELPAAQLLHLLLKNHGTIFY